MESIFAHTFQEKLEGKDKKSLKKLEALDDYPGDKYDISFWSKIGKLRKLQGNIS